MKKVLNYIIVIVVLALVASTIGAIYAFVDEFGSESNDDFTTDVDSSDVGSSDVGSSDVGSSDVGGSDDSSEAELQSWTLENGDIGFYCNYNYDKNKVYIKFAKDGLEPGKYCISWNINSSVFDTGACFIPTTSAEGVSGHGFYFNYFFDVTVDDPVYGSDSIFGSDSIATFYEDEDDLLRKKFTFDVRENGEFSIVLFALLDTSMEEGAEIRDFIRDNCIDYVILTKVG